ncbi:Aerobic respiration control sensor protein ArcB [Tautonia plasticadhaerens]|uniref:histidine kinase n=2 Tax=Tautonia plasticadhaerens TaxID=2527974 RepID=A0A518H7P9_9BACT|nr:Aerobic respiration control sensor protein ArcB [Tautonia plasticadhaerens]
MREPDDDLLEMMASIGGQVGQFIERRWAEEALRESEGRFARFMQHLPGLAWIKDAEGRYVYANEAAERAFRAPRSDLYGRTDEEVFPPETAAQFRGHDRRALGSGEGVQVVETLEHEDGVLHHSLVSKFSMPGPAGEAALVGGIAIDVTERLRAEEALRRSEERLRLIVESATDYAIFTLDPDGRVASWNSGARNLLGYEEREIVGKDGSLLFIPEDIERGVPEQEIRKALDQGRAENERWHVRKDGTRFWASGLLMPMRDGGEVVGLLKIMRDTTEQKRTEQELAVSRERLDLVVNSSEVGLWYCDLPFDRLIWNAKCKEHFGLPPDAEVTIDTFYERLHPDDREPTRRAIGRSIEGRSEYDAEFRTVDPQGRVRWVRAIGQPFYDVEGTPLRFDGITVDVTGRIRQEEALREADRRKDEFLATLAHELRNPLAPIRTALHLMARPDGSGGGHEPERAMAERQVVHLARLIDDLMDVARISKGKLDLHTEVVDLHTVVRQAVETARTHIDDRRHRLTVSIPEGPILLEADPTRLEQVFWNLLNNAAKYTEPGGQIDLTAETVDGQVVVRVRDTGIGIDPEMLPRLFQMFVQVGEHRQHAQGGLGIGLGLVRTLVELHGGTIEAHSEGPGTGSEFVVRLPMLLATSPVPTRPGGDRRRDTEADVPRRRILIVDDNADAANVLAKLLGRLHGQDVRVAHDGPAGLEAAEAFRPEVALLDIGLPGMSGHEVARTLRGQPGGEQMTLIALTGWGQEADRQRSKEAGFDLHLVKPVDPDDLIELLRTIAPRTTPTDG